MSRVLTSELDADVRVDLAEPLDVREVDSSGDEYLQRHGCCRCVTSSCCSVRRWKNTSSNVRPLLTVPSQCLLSPFCGHQADASAPILRPRPTIGAALGGDSPSLMPFVACFAAEPTCGEHLHERRSAYWMKWLKFKSGHCYHFTSMEADIYLFLYFCSQNVRYIQMYCHAQRQQDNKAQTTGINSCPLSLKHWRCVLVLW